MTGTWGAVQGDCLDVLRTLGDASFDSIVTDPPYGLGFMGKKWDTPGAFVERKADAHNSWDHVGGNHNPSNAADQVRTRLSEGRRFQEWCEEWAVECLRVLKPGGHLVAFGGTRTYHRMACAIEDAGFEIRDSLHWLYGSGFPKSMDVSKAIDKAAGATREVIGHRVRLGDTKPYAHNPASAIYNTDNGVATGMRPPETAPATEDAARWDGWGTALKPGHEPIVLARKPFPGTVAANVLEHGTGALNIDGCRVQTDDTLVRPYIQRGDNEVFGKGPGAGVQSEPAGRWPPNVLLSEEAAAELDRQSGTLTSGANPARRSSDKFRDAYGEFAGQAECQVHRGADSGGASRFFPVFRYQAKAPKRERPAVEGVAAHPTVKPVELMRWLVRLVTSPGGRVLDPFAGTGTTAEACVLEGFDCTLVEREPDYIWLTAERMERYREH